ncbi:NADH:flavin oxidoreductase [Clostridium saudiense]|uniref:NADH:flavin oxidoreductase n=1 Tax=Clostridium saudiense TaxID=1414720 RepID=UPI0004BB7808|nr:NADH:flavin oxidoreductase [Clostridium saudiense]MDU7453694.1 NADH:flavin oxidoreductase [Clostridium saudiense]SCJ87216.1 NADH oxidase [uncultured Clostridium sp.]
MAELLKPLVNSKLQLNNRLVLPPMATAKCEDDGKVTQEILDYYDEKSKGGYISLIIIEHSFIEKQGKAHKGQLSIANDNLIEDLKKLSNIIHKNGSKAIMQINHAGSLAKSSVTGCEIVGPSAIMHPRNSELPKELTKEDIKVIISNFRNAARRVKNAGFDGVEIHSAHGYLLNEFYSPITNKRSDEYGGDIFGRIKLHLEIIRAIRDEVGKDFPILLRLGACDYTDGGNTIDDCKAAVVEFQKSGVDIIDISGGLLGYIIPGVKTQGYFSNVTEEVKKNVSIPVILTGGITDAEEAEKLLKSGKADLIGVGRAILKDSLWSKKAIESLK